MTLMASAPPSAAAKLATVVRKMLVCAPRRVIISSDVTALR